MIHFKRLLLLGILLMSCFLSNSLAMKRATPEEGHDKSEATGQPPKSISRLAEPEINLGARPTAVQEAVDRGFEAIKERIFNFWTHDGSFSSGYRLLGLDDELVIKNLAIKNPDQKNVYVLDVGCGCGGWGQCVMRFILNEEFPKTGKHFYIFSVTGGQECEETIESKGNVTLYQLKQFKIENIDEEFFKRGFALKNRFDLIVSNWTLRHLVDPWGTLKRMYSLLSPAQGILMANGFLFAFDDSEEVQDFPAHTWSILAQTNTVSLFRHWDLERDTGQFLLMKNNDQDLAIPLEYTGKIRHLDLEERGHQCASKILTAFKRGHMPTDERFWFKLIRKKEDDASYEDGIWSEGTDPFGRCYCHKDNQQSKDLYALLKSLELLSRPSLGK